MTSVRDLLDIAASEIDVVSNQLGLGEGPSAHQVAAAWNTLLLATQHLVIQTVGRDSRLDRALFGELAALEPPGQPAGSPSPALVRAAQALGAAGDLLTTAIPYEARAERLALYREATQLMTAAAEVTLHGLGRTFEHGPTLTSVAHAGALARRLSALVPFGLSATRHLAEIAIPAPVVPRDHPLGPLDRALHEWSHLAINLPSSTALSSRDLHGATLVAGHLVAAARVLLAQGPPDATSPPDARLHDAGLAWCAAGSSWTGVVLPGRPEPTLLSASWAVVREVRAVLAAGAPGAAATPAASSALRRAVIRRLTGVADAHLAAVTNAASTGQLVVARRSVRSMAVGPALRRFDWVAAPGEVTRTLVSSYHRASSSLRPDRDVPLPSLAPPADLSRHPARSTRRR